MELQLPLSKEIRAGVMKIYTRKYGHPGVPILRDSRDPVIITGTPFSMQTAEDTDDPYNTGGYGQFSEHVMCRVTKC